MSIGRRETPEVTPLAGGRRLIASVVGEAERRSNIESVSNVSVNEDADNRWRFVIIVSGACSPKHGVVDTLHVAAALLSARNVAWL